ncbi:hypothetical protein [Paraburkholderia jirisanensis]
MANSDVVEATIEFVDWHEPWLFHRFLLKRFDDNADDRTTVDLVWAEACRSDHWRHATISQCCDASDRGLEDAFPWLPEDARRQFVRAASFQWK